MSEPTVPLLDVPDVARERLAFFGAPEGTTNSKLYQALSNEPELLVGWLDLAWRLRAPGRRTSPRLRELMVVLAVQIAECAYELAGHRRRALALGVGQQELDELATWRESTLFSEDERLAFRFMEEMIAGRTSDETNARLAERFDAGERIELILVAAFYCMAPRVSDALRLVP